MNRDPACTCTFLSHPGLDAGPKHLTARAGGCCLFCLGCSTELIPILLLMNFMLFLLMHVYALSYPAIGLMHLLMLHGPSISKLALWGNFVKSGNVGLPSLPFLGNTVLLLGPTPEMGTP